MGFRLALIGILFLLPAGADAASVAGIPCANPHIATANDIAAGFAAGSYVCPRDEETTLANQSGPAKEFLKKRWKGDGDPECPIEKLDPSFAICAASAVQQVNATVHRAFTGCPAALGAASQGNVAGHAGGKSIDIKTGTAPEILRIIATRYGLKIATGHEGYHLEGAGGCAGASTPSAGKNQPPTPQAKSTEELAKALSGAPAGAPADTSALGGSEWVTSIGYDIGAPRSGEGELAPIGQIYPDYSSANFESLGYTPPQPRTDLAAREIGSIAGENYEFSSVGRNPVQLAQSAQESANTLMDRAANAATAVADTFGRPSYAEQQQQYSRLNPFIAFFARLFGLVTY